MTRPGTSKPSQRWDIFCTVVDNFGDIGIAWRLARQLADEHALRVRLWVDDLASFRCLHPGIDPTRETQTLAGVEICHWRVDFPAVEPGDVVIEAFACHLPESFEHAMARCSIKPVWINLEYLSAEDWVAGCHGLPSPHPRLPLIKYFYMPGYTANTGGVLKEVWLDQARQSFQADEQARNHFWQTLDVPPASAGETRVSLFSYESSILVELFAHWSRLAQPMRCLVPIGKSLTAVARFFGIAQPHPGDILVNDNLSVHILPMLELDRYDRLLWACDCNFVRGEDSFVRAQWACKPLVWQAYRQDDQAHLNKLNAFLDRYCHGLDRAGELALRNFWLDWNQDDGAYRVRNDRIGTHWDAFWAQRDTLSARARTWSLQLHELGNLAGNLVKFCAEKI